jgi:hypothetical protein
MYMMSDMKQEVKLDELMKEFTLFLLGAGIEPTKSCFGRDVIIQCLGKQIADLIPPVPGILSEIEGENVKYLLGYKIGHFDMEMASSALDKEAMTLMNRFKDYLKSLGYDSYILFSECFYDEKSDDELVKAFKLSSDYDLDQFIEEENLSLMVRDTILISPDMTKLLILFHHHFYEIYDKVVANEFLTFLSSFGAADSV